MWESFKKQLIPNTITFVVIVLFILIFKSIFGDINTLVGVTVITAALIFVRYDLTKGAIKNLFILTCINILFGIMSYLATTHIVIGLLINFLALAGIAYVFSAGLTKSLVIPFGLQYLFMLYTPVAGIDLYKRIAALAFGAVFIMLLQLLMYFVKKKKASQPKTHTSPTNEELALEEDTCIKDPSEYYILSVFGKKVYLHKLRASYAFRLGLFISLTAFVTSYFSLAEGKWMSYTIFSVTELYTQNTRLKARYRIRGTIIGTIIVIIAFFIFTDNSTRTLLILLAGYLNSFFKDYKYTVIIITISAVASVALTQGSIYTGIERILFVVIGTILALLGNKFDSLSSK